MGEWLNYNFADGSFYTKKISAVHCLILSQSTRVTDGQTDEQNYDS